MQGFLYFLHQPHGLLLGVELLGLLQAVKPILLAVHHRQVEQRLLVAPLRHGERYAFERKVYFKRQNYLFRRAVVAFAHLGNAQRQQLVVAFVELFLVFKRERLVDAAPRDVDIVDESRLFVACYREDVNVVDGVAHHLALCHEARDEQVAALHLLGLFKAQLACQPLHLVAQHAQQPARVALQYLAGLGNAFLVVFIRLFAHAWRPAVLYVILQAHAVFVAFYAVFRYREMACARLAELLYQLQDGVHRADVRVGPVVGAPLLVDGARLEHPRKHLVGDANARVCLAVFQQNIVARVVFLDKAVFQQQRVFLGVYHRVGYVVYLAHQHLRLVAVYFGVKIRRHSALQVFCLAHIDYRSMLVVILIAAGLLRQSAYYALQVGQPFLVFFFRHLS